MLGGTLALLNHSLQTDTRLLRHHVYRLVFVVFIYGAVLVAHGKDLLVGAPGMLLFGTISWLNFAFITLAGVSFFATAVTEEKEEQTLPLLRMAGIGPAALLLGKSTSRLVIAGLLLSLQFPFTLLSITLGGVTFVQVAAVYLALVAYTVMVANMALFCSVACTRSNRAAALMLALLGLFFLVPPLVETVGSALIGSGSGRLAAILKTVFGPKYEISVANRLATIMGTGFKQSPISFQVLSNAAVGPALFLFSWLMFDRLTIYRSADAPPRNVLLRPAGRLKMLGPRRAWAGALIWKDFHFVTGGLPVLIGKLVVYGLIVALVAYVVLAETRPFSWGAFAGWAAGLMTAALAVESSIYAARIFNDELKWGTLPALMMLPVSVWKIGYSKVGGCLLGLLPAAFWLVVSLAPLPVALRGTDPGTFVVVGFGIVSNLVMFAMFLHLTAFFSLVVKWGALPLAFAVVLVGWQMISCFFTLPLVVFGMAAAAWGNGLLGAVISSLPALAVGGGVCFGLQLLIGQRLRVAATR